MANLIKVTSKAIGGETQKTANARELWEFLETKQKFGDWIKNQIESLNLEKDLDYLVFNKKVKRETGATVAIEYIMTLDIAKHIAMASRTQKGREVRQYFIEVEKKYQKTTEENIRSNVIWEVHNEYKELDEKIENMELAAGEYVKSQIQINQQIALITELFEAINADIENKSIDLLLQKTNETKDFINKLFQQFLDIEVLTKDTVIVKEILEAGRKGEVYKLAQSQ